MYFSGVLNLVTGILVELFKIPFFFPTGLLQEERTLSKTQDRYSLYHLNSFCTAAW